MLKIRALNRESSSDEEAPTIRREAQEEIVLDMYNKALKHQFKEEFLEAEQLLTKLIEENIPQLESEGGLPKTMSNLKYSCYVNLGNISLKQTNTQKALDNYTIAAELDKKDVSLWYKIGKLALKLDKFQFASYAFYMGLECNESHWPSLDALISVLFAIKDCVSCLCYIGKALILDPNYSKGLVLRKKIYEDNPATKEYYKLFNKNHIYEPSLDVPVDEEDEEYFLKDVQVLCDRVNEVEKALGPKPLECIPLPFPLEDFTWVSVAKAITGFHQYLTDNNMTHFTFVDLKTQMKIEEEPIETVIEEDKMEVDMKQEEVLKESEEKPVVSEIAIPESQHSEGDSEIPVERRMSQTSENNFGSNEVTESVNIITDTEEMEQETEDQEETPEVRPGKSRHQARSSKRKRDLLSDLQIWGWHSKRKYTKKGKNEKDFKVEDAFTRIIPSYLLPNGIIEEKYNPSEDSMNTMDIYRLHVGDHEEPVASPIHLSKTSENERKYFGTPLEKEEVVNFWNQKWVACDAVNLIEGLVYALAERWKLKWPKELIPLYLKAYNMFREHFSHPMLYGRDEVTFDMLRIDALATLLYGELTTLDNRHSFSNDHAEIIKIHMSSVVQIEHLSAWNDKWKEEHLDYFLRVHWLRSHLFRMEGQNSLSIIALELVLEGIHSFENEKYRLHLPNCQKYSTINMKVVESLLKNLEMIESLSRLEDLFNGQKYNDVASVLKATFASASQHISCKRLGRPAQLGMLMHSLWMTDTVDCFVWTEECFYESVENYLRPKKFHDKWEMLVEKCLLFFHEIVKTETVCIFDSLSESKRARLIETLTRLCCKQINMEHACSIPLGSILPWIILHYILLREEHRSQATKRVRHKKKEEEKSNDKSLKIVEEEEVPPSVAVLLSAHEFLGPKGWCLTNQGQLLHFIVDTILDRLDTPIFDHLRDKLDIHLEQAFFCLYQHPSKKNKISRHLADHNVPPLPLTWEKAQQIYEFFCPCALPEFDSVKSVSISSDLEQLLQRITCLVPTECDPQPLLPKLVEFMNGTESKIPDPIEFPIKTRSIYYLLGDYYFKQSDVKKSAKYFQLDLCINPWRLDSWACLALGIASQLEQKLTHCERFKNENEFLDKANSAKICFQQALTLANDHVTLWIEYGSFEYMVHSYCSRVLKYESDTLSMERFEFYESKKEMYLQSSKKSFLRALELFNSEDCDIDERWLYHYMLAKISEKCQTEPMEYLQHYQTAAIFLKENKAEYPEKINYTKPQHLAIEALEVNYRINASILKYLELHEGKEISSGLGKTFKKYLESNVLPSVSETKKTAEKLEKTAIENIKPKDEMVDVEAEIQAIKIDANITNSKMADPVKDEAIDNTKTSDIPPIDVSSVENKTDCEIQSEIKQVVEDLVTQVEQNENSDNSQVKEEFSKTISENDNKQSKTEKPKADVIVLTDSEEDVIMEVEKDPLNPSPGESVVNQNKNIQDLMDQMMEETMNNQKNISEDIEMDVAAEEVIIASEENGIDHIEKTAEPKEEVENIENDCDDLKKESETETKKSIEDSTSSSSSSSDSSSSDSDSDDSSSSSSSSSSDTSTGNMSDSEILYLVDRCINGLEQCIKRLPQNYKAIYRLAHVYFHYTKKKDLSKSKQLFLSEYKCKNNTLVTGLFSDRKTSNFFNGIWRIPSGEIDRPGSLSAHMSRCVNLLLQILRSTNDHKALFDLCLQLKRVPDIDKVYIRDTEREQLSELAMSLCAQTLKEQLKNASTTASNKLLGDIFKAYQRCQKSLPSKESFFANLMNEVYKKIMGDKIPENSNLLDLAIKHCQQNRVVEKMKRQQSQPALPKSPMVTTSAPVLPSPSTIGPNVPLKRPGVGRPRGRPPGPKRDLGGQTRSPRGRSPMSTSNNPFFTPNMYETKQAYDYLRQYQEHLMRQYSNTLTLTQMVQSMTPTTTSSNLMNQNALLQAMQQMTSGLQSLNSNQQLAQTLNRMNPNLLKKMAEQMAISSLATPTSPQLSQDQLKQLASLMAMTKPSASPKATSMPSSTKSSSSKSSLTYTQASSSKTTTTGSYKSQSSDSGKTKPKDVGKTSNIQTIKDLQIIPTNPQILQQDLEKAAVLMKERPNISITPVTQQTASVKPPNKPAICVPSTSTKLSSTVTTTRIIDIDTPFSKPSSSIPNISSKITTIPVDSSPYTIPSKSSSPSVITSLPTNLPKSKHSPTSVNLSRPSSISPNNSKDIYSSSRSSPTAVLTSKSFEQGASPSSYMKLKSTSVSNTKTTSPINISAVSHKTSFIPSKSNSPTTLPHGLNISAVPQKTAQPAHAKAPSVINLMSPESSPMSKPSPPAHSKAPSIINLMSPESNLISKPSPPAHSKGPSVINLMSPDANPISKPSPPAHSKSNTASVFTKPSSVINQMPPKPMVPPTSSSPTKTLQEILADKQKQASGKNLGKKFDTAANETVAHSDYYKSAGQRAMPTPLSVLSTFPSDTTITVTQVPASTKSANPVEHKSINLTSKDQQSSKPMVVEPSGGIDLSSKGQNLSTKPMGKPERKESSDDDVIFIG